MASEKEITIREEEMLKIENDLVNFRASPLYKYRTKNKYFPVIGEGSNRAKIMFVGEAPGKKEALTGKPFCGAAGKFLDELLGHIKLNREDVYITNIVKDRPQENRDPTAKEITAYGPFLDRQIEIIEPLVIATLGRFSMKYIMEKFDLSNELESISKAHGKSYIAKTSYGKIKIIPFYHPAAALYNGGMRNTLKKDFEILKKI
ncbi:MAG: uracil-DNA glycosylase [Candidatus Paceibacterota bacterium]